MSVAFRLRYGFAPSSGKPHPNSVLSSAQCSTAGQLELQDQGVPELIRKLRLITVMLVCVINTKHKVFPTEGLEEMLLFVSVFEIYVLASTQVLLFLCVTSCLLFS